MYSKEQLQQFVVSDWHNALSYTIHNNPQGVYNYIKKAYGNQFPLWGDGVAQADGAMQTMYDFLAAKFTATGKPAAYMLSLATTVAHNPKAGNWTIPQ